MSVMISLRINTATTQISNRLECVVVDGWFDVPLPLAAETYIACCCRPVSPFPSISFRLPCIVKHSKHKFLGYVSLNSHGCVRYESYCEPTSRTDLPECSDDCSRSKRFGFGLCV